MLSVTASTVVSAAPERIWDLISDTTRYAEWVQGTEKVTRSEGPAREGSTYDEVNPILGPWKARTTWTVVEFAPLHRQVHTSGDIPLASHFDVIMELESHGTTTRFTLTLQATPALGPVGLGFERLMRRMVERDNRKTADNLVELVRREQVERHPA
jgi:carbon monoxide dehydrogenase subunit G